MKALDCRTCPEYADCRVVCDAVAALLPPASRGIPTRSFQAYVEKWPLDSDTRVPWRNKGWFLRMPRHERYVAVRRLKPILSPRLYQIAYAIMVGGQTHAKLALRLGISRASVTRAMMRIRHKIRTKVCI